MITLIAAFALLILGYVVYGAFVERVFGPDERETPAFAVNDGVDCIPLKTWRAFLIELLNIAGTGPIFGALMGAMFGPVVFLWIVFGSILGGAVHDYLTGMISSRHGGVSIVELSGIYLGKGARFVIRIFATILLILIGTVFITSPAALLSFLSPEPLKMSFWLTVIIAYYVVATLLPIDKLIARLYPFFGIVLIIMAAGIIFGLVTGGYHIPEISLQNMHPEGLPIWPFMFITVACGAISGFHSTQAPIISKCIQSEKDGRKVFYGAMICEATIALVWAAAGVSFYESTAALGAQITAVGQSGVVYQISEELLGVFGGILAVIGVAICPISSGDTAFRSARLILAEWLHLDQSLLKNRLFLTTPLLAVGALLSQLDFDILWRYSSWANQTLAMVALWVISSYLVRRGKNPLYSLVTALPAAFMSAVTFTYILMASEGLGLTASIAYPAGLVFALLLFCLHLWHLRLKLQGKLPAQEEPADQQFEEEPKAAQPESASGISQPEEAQ